MSQVEISLTRLPHQTQFIRASTFTKALITGYGGGKTLIGSANLVLHSMLDSGIPHMAVSPSYPMAKKTVIPAIYEMLEERCRPRLREGRDFSFNRSEHIFHIHPWRGVIWVGSATLPHTLKGPNLGSVWLDEPGLMPYEAYKTMISRVRHPRAKHRELSMTGTPEGLGWLYDVCEGDKKPDSFTLVKGKTTDNLHLPQDYIDNLLQQYDAVTVEAYVNGRFVNMAGMSAYHEYKEPDNLISGYEPLPGRPLLIGMDFNYSPMTLVIAQETMINGVVCIVVFDEIYSVNCDTDAQCEKLLDRYGGGWQYEIYPDPACTTRSAHGAAKSDIALIRQSFGGINHNIHAHAGHQKRRDRLNAVNGMLCNTRGVRRLLVGDKCKQLRRDLTRCPMEEYLNGNFKDSEMGHISDALGYLIGFRYPLRSRSGFAYNRDFIA